MSWVLHTSAAAWRSFRALDPWVQVWVSWLVAINVASVRELDHPTGRNTAGWLAAWLPVNTGLVIAEEGLGRSLSIAHLVAYPPTVKFAVDRLRSGEAETREQVYAALIAATNSISLAFDVVEVARWVLGDRAVAGADA